MSKFIISFSVHEMDHVPSDDMPIVADGARAVVHEIVNAGVYVLAGGLENRRSSIVATDGTVTHGPEPRAIGGVTIVDVPAPRSTRVGRQECCRVSQYARGPGDWA